MTPLLPTSTEHERIARRIVIISALALFIIFGIRLSFGVFFAEFVEIESWSNESSAAIYSASMIVFAVGSTPSGILLDRYGPRIVFGLGAFLLALGLFLSSYASDVRHLMLSYGIISGTGLALFGLGPFAAVIAGWVPPARRGRAIGIVFAGTGFGSLLFVPLSTWLIESFGWRNAYLVLGLLCLFVLAPLLIAGQQKPPVPTLRGDQTQTTRRNWRELLTNPLFWAIIVVALTAIGPLRSLTVHHVAYMESVGVKRQTAANFVGLAGFLTAGTFIGWGFVSDRFGRAWTFTLGALFLIGAVGILVAMQQMHGYLLLGAYSVLLALGEGTRSSQSTVLASDIFQDYGLGLVNGIVGAMFGLGAAFGPWIVGRLRDTTGSYFPGLMTIVILVVISAVAFLLVSVKNGAKDHTKELLISEIT